MFLSPIFFPLSALPEWLRPWVTLNPIAFPVEQSPRCAHLRQACPDFAGLAVYAAIALAVAALGLCVVSEDAQGICRCPLTRLAIRVRDVSKHYLLFERPDQRLKQMVVPRLQRLAGGPAKTVLPRLCALKRRLPST